MDLSKFVMTDRDTAIMAFGCAIGGLQTPAIKRVIGESPRSGIGILTSTSGLAAIAVGLTCIGIGVGTRTGTINFNRDASTFALGYGISAIISIAINCIFSK
jgi:hypothetical protein